MRVLYFPATWTSYSLHLLSLRLKNGDQSQYPPTLFVEMSGPGPLMSKGIDWTCPSDANASACREPTAEPIKFDTSSTLAGLEAVAFSEGGDGAVVTAAASSTVPMSLRLWSALSAKQSSAAPGDMNRIGFRLVPAAPLKNGDLVIISGLYGFDTPNAPSVICQSDSNLLEVNGGLLFLLKIIFIHCFEAGEQWDMRS